MNPCLSLFCLINAAVIPAAMFQMDATQGHSLQEFTGVRSLARNLFANTVQIKATITTKVRVHTVCYKG